MTRLAIAGLGAVTRDIHLPAYRKAGKKVSLVGGCDPHAGARTSFSAAAHIRVATPNQTPTHPPPPNPPPHTNPPPVSIPHPPPPNVSHQQTTPSTKHTTNKLCRR